MRFLRQLLSYFLFIFSSVHIAVLWLYGFHAVPPINLLISFAFVLPIGLVYLLFTYWVTYEKKRRYFINGLVFVILVSFLSYFYQVPKTEENTYAILSLAMMGSLSIWSLLVLEYVKQPWFYWVVNLLGVFLFLFNWLWVFLYRYGKLFPWM